MNLRSGGHVSRHRKRLGGQAPALLCLLSLGLAQSANSWASEPQYRQLTLVDGRVYYAEILETVPEGLRLRMPQGETTVRFELLKDMIPTTAEEYSNQQDWIVWVDFEPYQALLEGMLADIEGMSASRAGAHQPGDPQGDEAARRIAEIQSECSGEIGCIISKSKDLSWRWIVTGSETSSGEIVLYAKTNTDPLSTPNKSEPFQPSNDQIWTELHKLFELSPPDQGAPSGGRVRPQRMSSSAAFSESKVVGMSFVPVPGLPSLLQGDTGGFATALGIVVPSTALWMGASWKTGQSSTEFLGLSVAGFYTATVLANQVTGLKSLERGKKTVGVVPSRGGSPVVTVGAQF